MNGGSHVRTVSQQRNLSAGYYRQVVSDEEGSDCSEVLTGMDGIAGRACLEIPARMIYKAL